MFTILKKLEDWHCYEFEMKRQINSHAFFPVVVYIKPTSTQTASQQGYSYAS